MIDDEKRNELRNAYEVLTRHNLYRRGYCNMEAAEIDTKELGIAIDTAAGAILEYLRLADENERLQAVMIAAGVKPYGVNYGTTQSRD